MQGIDLAVVMYGEEMPCKSSDELPLADEVTWDLASSIG